MKIDIVCLNRRISAEEIEELSRIEAENFGITGLNRYTLPPFVEFGRVYVLYADGNPAGLAELMRGWDGRTAYLFGISIRKEFRGKGLGRRLLQKIIDDLTDDTEALYLTVKPDNQVAIKLYRSLGFVEQEYITDCYGRGEDRILMVREVRGG